MITFDNISEEDLECILQILLKLAKRKDSSHTWWAKYNYETEMLLCNICLIEFCAQHSDNETLDHMLFHIKDSNLMVFL